MFSTISVLVLACAITINAQSQCSDTKIGAVPTSHGVKLQPILLEPSIADWRIDIPHVPECAYGVSGVYAIMCDADAAPTGYFNDSNKLIVHRNGELKGVGTVTVTVYCKV